jgi:hypothetical protein
MNICIYGTEGSMILTFREKTVSSTLKDLAGRTVSQRTLLPLSVLPSKRVLSDISIRMNLMTIAGNLQTLEQNIRLEVDLRSQQESELQRYQRMFHNIQSTVDEICKVTDRL